MFITVNCIKGLITDIYDVMTMTIYQQYLVYVGTDHQNQSVLTQSGLNPLLTTSHL